jgi:hypothetical protein
MAYFSNPNAPFYGIGYEYVEQVPKPTPATYGGRTRSGRVFNIERAQVHPTKYYKTIDELNKSPAHRMQFIIIMLSQPIANIVRSASFQPTTEWPDIIAAVLFFERFLQEHHLLLDPYTPFDDEDEEEEQATCIESVKLFNDCLIKHLRTPLSESVKRARGLKTSYAEFCERAKAYAICEKIKYALDNGDWGWAKN